MSHWSSAFVGIPYCDKGRSRGGVDCWGLVHLVYTVHLRRDGFPSYAERYASDDERREISAIVAGEARSSIWRKIDGSPNEFDVLFFRIGRWDSHAGVALDDRRMLHVSADGLQSVVERWDTGRWTRTISGIYRYEGAAS